MTLSILHITAPGEVGGLEQVVLSLAAGHRQRGCRVSVAAVMEVEPLEHPFLSPLRDHGVEVFPLVYPGRHYLREQRGLMSLLQRIRPSVVHTHGYRADVIGGGAARRLGFPTITTVHGFTGGGWKNHVYEWLQRRSFRQFDAVVAVSRPLAEKLEQGGVPPKRLHLLPNGWGRSSPPLEREAACRALGLPRDGFHIGWVGRLSEEKGADVLLDALPYLSELAPVVSLVGDGRMRGSLEQRARDLGVAERVRWAGVIPDAGRLFQAFDVFVLSSRTEGTPIVLFEAMAAGVPIVATRVGGVPDVVSEAEALIVEPEAPAELAAAIRAVHDEPGDARCRAAAARERLERDYALDPWLDRYETIYRSVLHLPVETEPV
ncbi:glycosyltransferase [soil metagenome]